MFFVIFAIEGVLDFEQDIMIYVNKLIKNQYKQQNQIITLKNSLKTLFKMQKDDRQNVLTHETTDLKLDSVVEDAKKRILEVGDKNGFFVEKRLTLLKELTEFKFGRYLLINRGLTGYYTRYINLYPKRKHEYNITHPLEEFILNSPGIVASQQRFDICQKLLKEHITDGMTVCSLPCGLMDDLLTLNLPNTTNVNFVGIDIDKESTNSAADDAKKLNLEKICTFYTMDAWEMKFKKEFDIVTSNMLVQYVNEDEKIKEFYKLIYESLKNNGILIISCLLPMSVVDWRKTKYKNEDVIKISAIFYDICQVKWSNFIMTETMIQQLKNVGFSSFEIHYDEIKRFPTILAKK